MSGPKYFKTNGHLLLCQASTCQRLGADLLYRALWQYLEREHLAYYKAGGAVRLTSSGCLGACQYGPALLCYRQRGALLEQAWYAAADMPLARRVAQAVQSGEALPTEQRYDLENVPASPGGA